MRRTAETGDRIRARTPPHVLDRIDARTKERLRRLEGADAAALGRRLAELDREWDIDRAVMLLFAGVGTLFHELGVRGAAWARMLHRVQLGFIGLHAAIGWCPPVSVLRRLGFRSANEICAERESLRAILVEKPSLVLEERGGSVGKGATEEGRL